MYPSLLNRSRSFVSAIACVSLLSSAFSVHAYSSFFFAQENGDVRILGATEGEQLGSALTHGDLNGDGIDDLIMGSPYFSTESKHWRGKVSVLFGKKEMSEDHFVNLAHVTSDIEILGERVGDQFGSSLSTGDVNNDGIDDLIVGAFNAGDSPSYKAGKAYVFYGSPFFFQKKIDLGYQLADLTVVGARHGDKLGLSLAATDINGDGSDDLLLGAPDVVHEEDNTQGAVYVLYASKDFPLKSVYNLRTLTADVVLKSAAKGHSFGSSIVTGNFDGDEVDDVLVGSYMESFGDLEQAGSVSFFPGADLLPDPYRIRTARVHTPSLTVRGTDAGGWLGFSLAKGDINSDGVDDALIGGFPYTAQSTPSTTVALLGGEFFKSQTDVLPYDQGPFKSITGTASQNMVGVSVAMGDLDGDQKDDVVLGAPGVSFGESKEEGDVYIMSNSRMMSSQKFNLSYTPADALFSGKAADDWFGAATEVLDFNGDGFDDVVMSGVYVDGANGTNSGEVYVMKGKQNFFSAAAVETPDVEEDEAELVSRGEFMARVTRDFDLDKRNADYLKACREQLEFCLFTFMARSDFDGIQFDPQLILYPDVFPAHPYYQEINTLSLLELIHGYSHLDQSPLHPNAPISKIQALKIVLGAADLLDWKDRLDLVEELGGEEAFLAQETDFDDVDVAIAHMWWYPRYVNFAALSGIIPATTSFKPDSPLTTAEMDQIITTTLHLRNR